MLPLGMEDDENDEGALFFSSCFGWCRRPAQPNR